ncbi:Mitochondrial substrate carrier family protein [Abeliophyllum distichum]|uniref:Mitochondrial substrate carrier family protein n=1 Tax=Abeliophyllum distichum TaxID=126358 RepID=A0ABD1S965_9LAMI
MIDPFFLFVPAVVVESGRLAQLESVVQRFAELTIAHKGEVKVIVNICDYPMVESHRGEALQLAEISPKSVNPAGQHCFFSSPTATAKFDGRLGEFGSSDQPTAKCHQTTDLLAPILRCYSSTHRPQTADSIRRNQDHAFLRAPKLYDLEGRLNLNASKQSLFPISECGILVNNQTVATSSASGMPFLQMDELLKRNTFATHAVAAAGSVALSTAMSYPLDTLKVLMQVGSGSRKQLSMAQVLDRVRAISGYSGLYSGIAFYKDGREDNYVHVSEALMAGLVAGSVESLESGRPPPVSNVRRPSDVITLEGWGALWRGLRPGLVRDSIFGGIFFSSWQFLHRAMQEWKAVGMDPMPRFDEEIGPLSPVAVSLVAGVSGSIAAAASHSFDTAKSRSQCVVLPKFVSMERKFLKWNRPGKRFERLVGIHPADRNLLMNGVWLRMARSGLASFVVVGSYFLAVDHLVAQ